MGLAYSDITFTPNNEWGGCHDATRVFEMLNLEGAQAGKIRLC